MMNLTLRDRDDNDITSEHSQKWKVAYKRGHIDLNKLISFLLMIVANDDDELNEAFEAVMYLFSMMLQCDGTLNMWSSRFREVDLANNELKSALAPDDACSMRAEV